MKKTLTFVSLGLASVLVLSACSTPAGGSMPGMDHGTTSPVPMASSASSAHNDADTMFAAMMIPHHRQALEMSEIMLAKKGLPDTVTQLAARIKAAQAPEIKTMTSWLQAWGEDSQGHSGHQMDGMLSGSDLDALKAAQGRGAARLFLEQMIAHHQGAPSMARTESSTGKNPQAVSLSNEIVKAQAAEIEEMKRLLAGL
ncbi:DUF305 domain-containing protein [Arthrobacter sp. NPDC090010]|uniref:DUF305 domain-containing protein n=1 Tax=Arthrobacter sp. NPDC090010 TaxID=3363942 RepID=UPI0038281695